MKRIIVACDGTGKSATRGEQSIPTNVTRFCRALSNSSDTQQIVFYQSGIGTQDLSWGMGKVAQAVGSGIEDNVVDAYTFVMNNYEPGDKLFIFGFSRGAFTARVLANIIARVGVIWKTYSWAFKDAMRAYEDGQLDSYPVKKIKPNESYHFQQDGVIPCAHDVEIEVVGCWDTVASLGVPWRPVTNAGGVTGEYQNYTGNLVKGIKNAFHALGLDEYRGPFTPNLWYLPKDHNGAINLKQCWFPGVHSNVGGGYPDRALANLTLAWMVDLCRPYLNFDKDYLLGIAELDRNPEKFHKTREGRKEGGTDGEYDTKYQGWGRGMSYDSYGKGETWSWKYRTPGAYTGEVTNETMHASVRERWDKGRENTGSSGWHPESLKGFQPKQKEGSGWQWVKGDHIGVWQQMKAGITGVWTGTDPKGAAERSGLQLEIPEAPFPIENHFPATDDWPSFESVLRFGGPNAN